MGINANPEYSVWDIEEKNLCSQVDNRKSQKDIWLQVMQEVEIPWKFTSAIQQRPKMRSKTATRKGKKVHLMGDETYCKLNCSMP